MQRLKVTCAEGANLPSPQMQGMWDTSGSHLLAYPGRKMPIGCAQRARKHADECQQLARLGLWSARQTPLPTTFTSNSQSAQLSRSIANFIYADYAFEASFALTAWLNVAWGGLRAPHFLPQFMKISPHFSSVFPPKKGFALSSKASPQQPPVSDSGKSVFSGHDQGATPRVSSPIIANRGWGVA